MSQLTVPILLAAFATSALAQTETTLPAAFDRAWGQSPSSSLLGQDSTRTQLVFASPFAAGTTLLGVGFRASAATVDRAAFTADIEIRVSSGPNAPGNLDGTFANNVGNDEVVVLPQQTVTIPAMPANRGTGVFAEVPFTVPFVFGSNGNTNLVVDVRVFGRSPGAQWSTDRVYAGVNTRSLTAGTGCGAATIGSSVSGQNVNVTVAGAPANGLAVLVPSFDQKEFVPGVPLPFDLASIGAGPGCDLLVQPQIGGLSYVLDATGTATASLPVPAALASTGLAFQWAYLVPPGPQNALGLETTASRSVFLGPRIAVPNQQYVWNLADANAATGANLVDACPIVKLTYQ